MAGPCDGCGPSSHSEVLVEKGGVAMIRRIRSSIPRFDSVVAIFLVMLAAGSLRELNRGWSVVLPQPTVGGISITL